MQNPGRDAGFFVCLDWEPIANYWLVIPGRVSSREPGIHNHRARWPITSVERFEMKRINHQEAYSFDAACPSHAGLFFSRLLRAEIGIHPHCRGVVAPLCAGEFMA
jgi:hypothetical protein